MCTVCPVSRVEPKILRVIQVGSWEGKLGVDKNQNKLKDTRMKLEPHLPHSISSLIVLGNLQENLAAFTEELHTDLPRDGKAEGGDLAGAREKARRGSAPLPQSELPMQQQHACPPPINLEHNKARASHLLFKSQEFWEIKMIQYKATTIHLPSVHIKTSTTQV